MTDFLTTRQAGEEIGAPEWTVRRICDELEPPIVRFGFKRLIPRDRLPELKQALAAHRERAPVS